MTHPTDRAGLAQLSAEQWLERAGVRGPGCTSDRRLLAYRDEKLSPPAARATQAHVSGCGACTRRFLELC